MRRMSFQDRSIVLGLIGVPFLVTKQSAPCFMSRIALDLSALNSVIISGVTRIFRVDDFVFNGPRVRPSAFVQVKDRLTWISSSAKFTSRQRNPRSSPSLSPVVVASSIIGYRFLSTGCLWHAHKIFSISVRVKISISFFRISAR